MTRNHETHNCGFLDCPISWDPDHKHPLDPQIAVAGGRRTGRTTRMLEAAVREARNCTHRVIILAASMEHARNLRIELNKICDREWGGRNPGAIEVRSSDAAGDGPSFDWDMGRFRFLPIGSPVFIDHYAGECRIEWLTGEIERLTKQRELVREAAHRYDQIPPEFRAPRE